MVKLFNKLGTYVGASGTHILSHTPVHTHTHILCIIIKFLMKIKVYHNITDWMILIGF